MKTNPITTDPHKSVDRLLVTTSLIISVCWN